MGLVRLRTLCSSGRISSSFPGVMSLAYFFLVSCVGILGLPREIVNALSKIERVINGQWGVVRKLHVFINTFRVRQRGEGWRA